MQARHNIQLFFSILLWNLLPSIYFLVLSHFIKASNADINDVRDEEPPARKNGHGGGAETVGIDPGTSTVAVVADVSADCSRASRPSSKKNLKTLALKY